MKGAVPRSHKHTDIDFETDAGRQRGRCPGAPTPASTTHREALPGKPLQVSRHTKVKGSKHPVPGLEVQGTDVCQHCMRRGLQGKPQGLGLGTRAGGARGRRKRIFIKKTRHLIQGKRVQEVKSSKGDCPRQERVQGKECKLPQPTPP